MIIPFGQAAETDKVGKKKQPMELEPCRDAQFSNRIKQIVSNLHPLLFTSFFFVPPSCFCSLPRSYAP